MTKAFTLSAVADADLSEKKGYVAKLLATNVLGTPKAGLCEATDVPMGIITQPGNADEDIISIAYAGYVAEAVLGGNVTQGDFLKSDANGKLVIAGEGASTEDEKIIAQALKTGVDGDMIPVNVGRFIN